MVLKCCAKVVHFIKPCKFWSKKVHFLYTKQGIFGQKGLHYGHSDKKKQKKCHDMKEFIIFAPLYIRVLTLRRRLYTHLVTLNAN